MTEQTSAPSALPTAQSVGEVVADGIARLSAHENPGATMEEPRKPRGLAASLMALVRSRTVWVLIVTTAVIGLFIALIPDDAQRADGYQNSLRFIFLVAAVLVVVFMFGLKTFLRSAVPGVLLLFGIAVEYVFMSPILPPARLDLYQDCRWVRIIAREGFWYWAYLWKHVIPSDRWECAGSPFPHWLGKFLYDVIGIGIPEDTAKLVPVLLLLLLVWGLRKTPNSVLSAPVKSEIIGWSKLDRATTLVLVAFAGGVGFVLFETLGQYLTRRVMLGEAPVSALIHALPAYVQGGFPIALGNGSVTEKDWLAAGDFMASRYGLMGGLMLTIPRTIHLMAGHGAWAAIAAYYVALARRQSWGVSILLVIFGVGIAATLHGAWDAFVSPETEAPMAMLSVVVLLAVCVQAMALDQRAGFKEQLAPFGRSLAPEAAIPDFPSGRTAGQQEARPVAVPPPLPLAVAGSVGTLVIEGSATTPGRRVPLQRAGARIELAPDVACAVNVHPTDPSRIGLKNLTTQTWIITMPDGRAAQVAPQKSAVLANDALIDFGPFRGRIEAASG